MGSVHIHPGTGPGACEQDLSGGNDHQQPGAGPMKKNQFTLVNWFFYVELMDEIVVCSLGCTERPECLHALASTEVHFGNED